MAKGFSGGRGGSSSSGSSGKGSYSGGGRGGSSSSTSSTGTGSRGGSSVGSARRGSSPAQSAANTRMWSQPATPAQVAALRAHGNHDGKYYSKGRAGQAIGESVRASGSTPSMGGMGSNGGFPRPSNTTGEVNSDPLGVLVRQFVELQQAPVEERCELSTSAVVYGKVMNDEPEVAEMVALQLDSLTEIMPAVAPPIALLADLEHRHLSTFQAEFGKRAPDAVLNLRRRWVNLKTDYVKKWVQARVNLTRLLGEAPTSIIASPEQAADLLLAKVIDPDLEEKHLRVYLSEYGLRAPDAVLDLIMRSLEDRVDAAETVAQSRIEMITILAQQSLPVPVATATVPEITGFEDDANTGPTPSQQTSSGAKVSPSRKRTRTSTTIPLGTQLDGTVTSIKPAHGATVSLKPGLTGWLHISKLRSLNQGRYVATVEHLLRVGQQIRVQVIAFNDDGQPRLEPVTSEVRS